MTLQGFLDLLDRCGSPPQAWPAGAGVGADRLLATSAQARAALAAQREVDGWFASTRLGDGSPDIAARARRLRQLAPEAPGRRAVVWWSGAAAGAAAASLAVWLGAVTGVAHASAEEPGQALAAALYSVGEGVDAG